MDVQINKNSNIGCLNKEKPEYLVNKVDKDEQFSEVYNAVVSQYSNYSNLISDDKVILLFYINEWKDNNENKIVLAKLVNIGKSITKQSATNLRKYFNIRMVADFYERADFYEKYEEFKFKGEYGYRFVLYDKSISYGFLKHRLNEEKVIPAENIADLLKSMDVNLYSSLYNTPEAIANRSIAYAELMQKKEEIDGTLDNYDKACKEIDSKTTELNALVETINKNKQENNQLEQEVSDKKEKVEKLKTDIENLSNSKVAVEQSATEAQAKADDAENRLNNVKNNAKAELTKYDPILKLVQSDAFDEKSQDSNLSTEYTGGFKSLCNNVKQYLENAKELYYNSDTIAYFLSALYTNQIIILSGPPGSGKTSLPAAVSKAIGAKHTLISVQPNWTDNQDLLGFYNPVDKTYHSTVFLDTMIEASKNKDKMYFICLDEMNLAHVEYYLSEILSAMESSNKEINLYSEHIWRENICDLLSQAAKNKQDFYDSLKNFKDIIKSLENLCQDIERGASNFKEIKLESNNLEFVVEKLYAILPQLRNLFRYKATIEIPQNVQIIGTLNMDETTKGISPKVIDRSYFIRIDNSNTVKESTTNATPESVTSLNLSVGALEGLHPEDKGTISEFIKTINEALNIDNSPYSLKSVSQRFETKIKKMYINGADNENVLLFKKSVIYGKLLPALNSDEVTDIDGLKSKIAQLLSSDEDVEDLKNFIHNMHDAKYHTFSYWNIK